MTSPGSTWAERNDTVKTEQKQELEKLRSKWNLECATAQKNKVAYVLKRSRDNYLRVMGSENGLLQYQAEVLEITTGIGNQKEVAIVERERIVDIVDDVFSNVPEDTLLGKFRADIQEEVRGVFSKKKVTPAVFAPEPSDGVPKNELVLEAKDIPGPSRVGIDIVRNKYTVITVGATLVFALSTAGTANAYSPNEWTNQYERSKANSQSYTAPDGPPQSATRDLGLYIPVMQWPFDPSTIGDGWGWRAKACDACSEYHQGVDFLPGYGANIPAVMNGTVVVSEFSGSLGQHVYIDDGYGMITIYGHMIGGSNLVNLGDKVTRGQIIGQVGNTGVSTGPHLHFSIQWDGVLMDPVPILQKYSQ